MKTEAEFLSRVLTPGDLDALAKIREPQRRKCRDVLLWFRAKPGVFVRFLELLEEFPGCNSALPAELIRYEGVEVWEDVVALIARAAKLKEPSLGRGIVCRASVIDALVRGGWRP